MIRFGSPERDYSLSNGDVTLEKGLRSQHNKDVQLALLACNRHQLLFILSKQVFHKYVDSCTSFVNQNGLN